MSAIRPFPHPPQNGGSLAAIDGARKGRVRSSPGGAAAPRAVVSDAKMHFQRGAVGGERSAVGGVYHRAALEDHSMVGDIEDLPGVLLDQNRREAFFADDAA